MKRAEEFINASQLLLQDSPLRKPENSMFIEAARARELVQMEAEWVELAEKCRQPLHVVMMGQVKSGKSTLLRCINLLEIPDSGVIKWENEILDFETKIPKSVCQNFTKKTVFRHFRSM